MSNEGLLGGLEHLAHRKVDNVVEAFIAKLSPSAKRFLSRNKTSLIGGLDVLATITGIVRPNNPTWSIIQTSFSSFVEGLEKATENHGVKNVSNLPADVVQDHVDAFNQNIVMYGLLSGDNEDCKNIAKWIRILQKNNSDLAKKAYSFVSSMTPRDISRFANLSPGEKTALLESTLPKEQVLEESEYGFVETQRQGLDVFLTDLDNKILKANKRLKKIRERRVADEDIISVKSDCVIYEEGDETDDVVLLEKTSVVTDTPRGGWKW